MDATKIIDSFLSSYRGLAYQHKVPEYEAIKTARKRTIERFNKEPEILIDEMPKITPLVSLRDHFAGLAMQGIVSLERPHKNCRAAAELAYEYADAMLAERDND